MISVATQVVGPQGINVKIQDTQLLHLPSSLTVSLLLKGHTLSTLLRHDSPHSCSIPGLVASLAKDLPPTKAYILGSSLTKP